MYGLMLVSKRTFVFDQEWQNSHFDAVLILTIQSFHRLESFGNNGTATDENTIDVKRKSEFVGDEGAWGFC